MAPKIDKDAYKQGRDFFNSGKTIKDTIEHMKTLEHDESKEFSLVIGFADAVLDKLRGIKR